MTDLWGGVTDVSLVLCLAAFYPSCWPEEQAGDRWTESELKSQSYLKFASKLASTNMYTRGISAKAAFSKNDGLLFT